MANSDPARTGADDTGPPEGGNAAWQTLFIEALAITSSLELAAAAAGVVPAVACAQRRRDPDFAREWNAALAEGYVHLEFEIVRRLRTGDFKTGDSEKFDFANAIRLLAAHRDATARGGGQVRHVTAAEVRASIDRKIEDIRRRKARIEAGAGAPS
ncbi:hypothetical protein [Porphyrobacter sp. YT40]|uniref:hypothetical protein n=1 Tax=Porphyrobacter sp. YT40 TaxID=2547601 RepID=UPI001141C040|nr:hypothetical protein [Porphyrobacter sp. YT40]QDH33266.1 hypothetical protein E2E27_02280 [Porphyrobacter sp. YT40]